MNDIIQEPNVCGSCRGYNRKKGRCGNVTSTWYREDRHPAEIACPAWESPAEVKEAAGPVDAGAVIRQEALPEKTEAGQMLAAIRKNMEDAARQMTLLADMMRATNERMSAMEQVIRTLEKVTPQQTREINRAIMDRAKEICEEYRIPGKDRAAAGAIRTDIRLMTGTKLVKEIARCDYKTVLSAILDWDNYEKIQAIRKRVST
jgi:hypothetical protein